MKVCIATNYDNGKGLQADMEMLRAEFIHLGHEVVLAHTEKDKTAPPSDLIVFLETVRGGMIDSAPRRWVVPNPEWWEYDNHLGAFELVLCKTQDAYRIFSERVGERARFIGWTARDRHLPDATPADAPEPHAPYALHVAGGSAVKGTDAVVKAWGMDPSLPELRVVSSVWKGKAPKRVKVYKWLSDEALHRLQAGAALHVQPSAYEGFGMVLWEALSTGAPLVTTDAPPMNAVPATALAAPQRHETLRAATLAHVTPETVLAAVRAALAGPPVNGRPDYLQMVETFKRSIAELAPRPALRAPTTPREIPELAIILPTFKGGEELLVRSLVSLLSQSSQAFEIVVAVDGGDDGRFASIASALPMLPIKLVDSPRPRGDVPHRNHARNAGWRATTLPFVAFIDADFLFPPRFVEHVLIELKAARARGRPLILTPCLAGVGTWGPADWLKESHSAVLAKNPEELLARAHQHPLDHGIYSGFMERVTDPEFCTSQTLGDMPEGMPITERVIVQALEGFDEEVLGEWGGDKEEFVDRLKGVAQTGLAELRLLTSVVLVHQPHERDPGAWTPEARKRQVWRERRATMIAKNSAWWRTRVDLVRELVADMLSAPPAPAPLPPGAPPPAPPGFAQFIAIKQRGRALRDRLACAVVGRWAGAVAEALKAEGVDAYETDLGSLLAKDPGAVKQIVLVDVLSGMTNDELAVAGVGIRRVCMRSAPIMAVERTSLGARDRAGLRAPLDYQRAIKGLTVGGQRILDGTTYTVFAGRLAP